MTVLTKPGAEPHDLELSPQDIAGMTQGALVVYADGFQPAVDEAVGSSTPAEVLDVADAATLTLTARRGVRARRARPTARARRPRPRGSDPHFWLDP